jgi:glycine cleavage system H lipoate-binding protein
MFPWVDGFRWTATHIIFLSLFFGALLTIVLTFLRGIWRTVRDFQVHLATRTCWRQIFAELPETERHCRHEFAGRVDSRICDNAFDCRSCENYNRFAALPAKVAAEPAAVPHSDKRLYHRGHTWVWPEWDGTYTIGLDDFAQHLIGHPDTVQLPAEGETIESDGVAWRMTKNGREIRVRAPIEGTVVRTGGKKEGWYVNVVPSGSLSLQHLLTGHEVRGWLAREVDRLQLQLSARGAPRCLADGGTLMPNLMDAEPQADWDAILESTFLG